MFCKYERKVKRRERKKKNEGKKDVLKKEKKRVSWYLENKVKNTMKMERMNTISNIWYKVYVISVSKRHFYHSTK